MIQNLSDQASRRFEADDSQRWRCKEELLVLLHLSPDLGYHVLGPVLIELRADYDQCINLAFLAGIVKLLLEN